jgi:hypothetical protein
MQLKKESVRFDETSGYVLFEMEVDGTQTTVKMPDIYLQDFFRCASPSNEYGACIFDNEKEIVELIRLKVAQGLFEKDGSILISEDG